MALKRTRKKAGEIINRHPRFTEHAGIIDEDIAIAVTETIALGRNKGIAIAAEAIARSKGENDA